MTKIVEAALTSGFVAVSAEANQHVWHLSLHRPSRKNALNMAMYADLTAVLQAFAHEPVARVLVLTGSEGCFTSGNDLADFAASGGAIDANSSLVQFMVALRDCPKPVVVAVEGVAIGIGATLLLHADAVFAAPDAIFAMPFAKLGLCPEYASSLLVPYLAGYLKACEWLMLGEPFSSEEALAGHLINAINPEPLAAAMAHAQKLAAMPPQAIATTKRLLRASHKELVQRTMQVEAQAFSAALAGPEFAAAVAAFFAKK